MVRALEAQAIDEATCHLQEKRMKPYEQRRTTFLRRIIIYDLRLDFVTYVRKVTI